MKIRKFWPRGLLPPPPPPPAVPPMNPILKCEYRKRSWLFYNTESFDSRTISSECSIVRPIQVLSVKKFWQGVQHRWQRWTNRKAKAGIPFSGRSSVSMLAGNLFGLVSSNERFSVLSDSNNNAIIIQLLMFSRVIYVFYFFVPSIHEHGENWKEKKKEIVIVKWIKFLLKVQRLNVILACWTVRRSNREPPCLFRRRHESHVGQQK